MIHCLKKKKNVLATRKGADNCSKGNFGDLGPPASLHSTLEATALPPPIHPAGQLLLTILKTFNIPVGEKKKFLKLSLTLSGTLARPSGRPLIDACPWRCGGSGAFWLWVNFFGSTLRAICSLNTDCIDRIDGVALGGGPLRDAAELIDASDSERE